MDEIECSKATAKRIIHRMRLYLNAPIEYSSERKGYFYNHTDGTRNSKAAGWIMAIMNYAFPMATRSNSLMKKNHNNVNWDETTWEGSRRAQLRQWQKLSIRERLQALDDMNKLAQHFQQIRKQGKFRNNTK